MTVSDNDVFEGSVSGGDVIPPFSLSVDYNAVYEAVYSASYDAITAYSETVTDGQQINSSALSYFTGILDNCFLPVDYVMYVGAPYSYGNQTYYEYCMAYGDLTLEGTRFSGNDVTIVTMRNSTYNRSVRYDYNQDVTISAPMYYSRSNLGDYSGVYVYDWSGLLIAFEIALGGCIWIIKKLLHLQF